MPPVFFCGPEALLGVQAHEGIGDAFCFLERGVDVTGDRGGEPGVCSCFRAGEGSSWFCGVGGVLEFPFTVEVERFERHRCIFKVFQFSLPKKPGL